MNHLGKLAVLGAVLAACGPIASATTFTGFITVQDAPAGDIGSVDSSAFVLSSVLTGASATGVSEPNAPNGAPNLISYVTNPTLFTFSTANINSSGLELYSGTSADGTESATFYATSYQALTQDVNGDYALTANGYFSDMAGNQTPGYDNITFDSGVINSTADTINGSVSEILTAPAVAPEPSSLLLLGTGLVLGAGMMLRRVRANV